MTATEALLAGAVATVFSVLVGFARGLWGMLQDRIKASDATSAKLVEAIDKQTQQGAANTAALLELSGQVREFRSDLSSLTPPLGTEAPTSPAVGRYSRSRSKIGG